MSSNSLTSRLPWQDRWTQPTLLQLLEPLKIQHRRLFEQLMEELTQFEQVDQIIHWYGFAWNWTIQYRLHDKNAAEPHTLLYLVPRVENPIIVIPLSDKVIEQLPLKRLNRFIRDGIKNAKHAVAIHWATWTPNSKAEVSFLADLLKRKCKLLLGVNEKPAVEAEAEAKPAKGATKAASAKADTKAAAQKADSQPEQPAVKTGKAGKAASQEEAKAGKSAKADGQKGKSKAAASSKTEAPAKAAAEVKKPAGKKGQAEAKTVKPAKAVATAPAAKGQSKAAVSTGKSAGKGKSSGKAVPQATGKSASKAGSKTPAKGKTPAKPAAKTATRPAAKAASKPAGKSKAGTKSVPAKALSGSVKAPAKGKAKLAASGRKK